MMAEWILFQHFSFDYTVVMPNQEDIIRQKGYTILVVPFRKWILANVCY